MRERPRTLAHVPEEIEEIDTSGPGALGVFTTREAAEDFIATARSSSGVVARWTIVEWNDALT